MTHSCLLLSVPGSAPTTLGLMADGAYNITISWNPPTIPNGIINGYTLYITFGNGSTTIERPGASDRQFFLSYLSPFETVTATISSSTVIGEGPRTVSRQAVTSETREYKVLLSSYFFQVKHCSLTLVFNSSPLPPTQHPRTLYM